MLTKRYASNRASLRHRSRRRIARLDHAVLFELSPVAFKQFDPGRAERLVKHVMNAGHGILGLIALASALAAFMAGAIAESVGTEGGVETYLFSVIERLRVRGHQIALLYYRRSKTAGQLRTSPHIAIGVEERGIDAAFEDLRSWRADVVFSHNMGPPDIDRRLLEHWPLVRMLHGYFGTCVSGLKMHAFPSAKACGRTFGPACLALYFPRRCGQQRAKHIRCC